MISKPPSKVVSASSRRRRPRFSNSLFQLLAVLALGLAVPRVAPAYVLEPSYWQIPVVPMRVQMGPADIVLADGSTDWDSVVVNALQLWNEQMDRMQFSWTVAAPGTPAAFDDGVNSIQLSSTVYGDDFGEDVLAVTLADNVGNRTTEADVLFNTANRFNSYRGVYAIFGGISYFDLHRIALHELGHVLGLDHPDEHGQTVFAIMNSHITETYFLQADDIAGAVALYGAPPDAPSPTGNSQILQLSTRSSVGVGDNVMIGGFIINGTVNKQVLVRAIGPSLGPLGVANPLQNPFLELKDANGMTLAANDDWRATQEQEIIDTDLTPGDDHESALIADLAPDRYTAIVTGVGDTTGVALVEVYDLEPENGKLANISTRAHVGTGDDVTIAGFIIKGPQSQKNVLRAVGPSLGSLGLQGPLANPALDLYNSKVQILQTNDDFKSNRDAGVIASYGLGLTNGFESSLYFESAPGNFTAIMRGVNGSTGIGLIEVYGVE
jgi:Matrixin